MIQTVEIKSIRFRMLFPTSYIDFPSQQLSVLSAKILPPVFSDRQNNVVEQSDLRSVSGPDEMIIDQIGLVDS